MVVLRTSLRATGTLYRRKKEQHMKPASQEDVSVRPHALHFGGIEVKERRHRGILEHHCHLLFFLDIMQRFMQYHNTMSCSRIVL